MLPTEWTTSWQHKLHIHCIRVFLLFINGILLQWKMFFTNTHPWFISCIFIVKMFLFYCFNIYDSRCSGNTYTEGENANVIISKMSSEAQVLHSIQKGTISSSIILYTNNILLWDSPMTKRVMIRFNTAVGIRQGWGLATLNQTPIRSLA